jgi:hypothetical protein
MIPAEQSAKSRCTLNDSTFTLHSHVASSSVMVSPFRFFAFYTKSAIPATNPKISIAGTHLAFDVLAIFLADTPLEVATAPFSLSESITAGLQEGIEDTNSSWILIFL